MPQMVVETLQHGVAWIPIVDDGDNAVAAQDGRQVAQCCPNLIPAGLHAPRTDATGKMVMQEGLERNV